MDYFTACRMKTIIGDETITASEDKVRKSLHELQLSATDENKETLVRADWLVKSTQQSKKAKPKRNVSRTTKDDPKYKNVKTKDKADQTMREKKAQIKDLTSTDVAGRSENYWQVVDERQQIAHKNVFEINKEFEQCVEELEEDKHIYVDELCKTNALIYLLEEMISEITEMA